MLAHAEEACDMIRGKIREDLEADRQFYLALLKLLEIIGEAATRILPATRDTYPQIRWAGVIGLRNRLVHGYDEVDLDILWDVLDADLPPLISELKKILK